MPQLSIRLVVSFATCLGFAAGAPAQCEPRWVSAGIAPGVGGNTIGVNASCLWDPDGAGPQGANLVVVGPFAAAGGVPASGVARWDGQRWFPIGAGLPGGEPFSTATWDPDGAGPLAPQLFAGGVFGIRQWNGTAWQNVDGGVGSGTVYALLSWDPDGAGPLGDVLVAAGTFTTAGGVTIKRVARWNGGTWQPFGQGIGVNVGTVYALTSWDPDGPGPLPPNLIAAGDFQSADTLPALRIARWDGGAWQALGAGLDAVVNAVTTWDPDGPGPGFSQLVAGGGFTHSGTVPLFNHLARWDGSAWNTFANAPSQTSSVTALTTWDADGDGPLGADLYIGGGFNITMGGVLFRNLARFDGATWSPLGEGLSWPFAPVVVNCFLPWDPDGAGPQPASLVTGGEFASAGGVLSPNLAHWDGSAWHGFGNGFDAEIRALTLWDDDGAGPHNPALVATGTFTRAPGITAAGVTAWNGAAWQPFGNGVVYGDAVTAWDFDGGGPLPARPVVANGIFVRRWDGAAWVNVGGNFGGFGSSSPVFSLVVGPPNQFHAGGAFLRNEADFADMRYIARWGGTNWVPVGSGAIGTGLEGMVRAMIWCDTDGNGPLPLQLVAGGEIFQASGAPVSYVARWTGSAWQALGPGVSSYVYAMLVWDRDGAGPEAPVLVVGTGHFSSSTAPGQVTYWNGSTWTELGTGMTVAPNGYSPAVQALTLWDPDGAGPLPAQLIAGGRFRQASGVDVFNLARWDGGAWQPLGAGTNDTVLALGTWDPDGAGPEPAWLAVGGGFVMAGGIPSARFAWVRPGSPCRADFNCDETVSSQDFFDFLTAFFSTAPNADFNHDGSVNSQDFFDFLAAFFVGC